MSKTLREAARELIDAATAVMGYGRHGTRDDEQGRLQRAVADMTAALAAEQAAPVAQPVAIGWQRPDGSLHKGCPPVGEPDGWTAVYGAPQAPVAQPMGFAPMTPGRAAFFLRRFKREEKLLGPNEQVALDFTIAMLEAPVAQQAEAVASLYITADGGREMDDWRHDLPPGSHILYTAQQTAVPLTERQCAAAIHAWFNVEGSFNTRMQAAFTAAHAITPQESSDE